MSTGTDGRVCVWDLATGAKLAAFDGADPKGGLGVAFAPDGKTAASSGKDGAVRLWRLPPPPPAPESSPPVERWAVDTHISADTAFSPDGTRLPTCGAKAAIRDAAIGKPLVALLVEKAIRAVYSRDGKRVAVSSEASKEVVVCDSATGKVVRRFGPFRREGWWVVTFTPDGSAVPIGHDNTLYRADVVTGHRQAFFEPLPITEMRYAAISPDGTLLVHADGTTGADGELESTSGSSGWRTSRKLAEWTVRGQPGTGIRRVVWTRGGGGLVCCHHTGDSAGSLAQRGRAVPGSGTSGRMFGYRIRLMCRLYTSGGGRLAPGVGCDHPPEAHRGPCGDRRR